MKPFISRIRIYPIKSLDPVELQVSEVGLHSLRYDREFAMLTQDGEFMNGKKSGRVNELKADYDIAKYRVSFSDRLGGPSQSFHLLNDKLEAEKYLSSFFKEPIFLVQNKEGKLMDIPTVSSVTIVSEASLQSLHKEFPHLTLENIRLRFRATIEIGGVEPYWEENLIGLPGNGVKLTIGEVEMIGISPRARCNVPPRDPLSGVPDKTFAKRMIFSRENSLPANSHLPAYGNLYHLTINTYVAESQRGKTLRVGDEINVIEPLTHESLQ